MTTAVTGIYENSLAADSALAQLIAAGFDRRDISVILKNTPDHEKLVLEETEDTSRGAVLGAIEGGVLASLGFVMLAAPGVGVLTAGPVLAALAAGGVGAMAGGLLGALTGSGVSAMAATEYEDEIRRGKVLVAVHTAHGRAKDARAVLVATSAQHISASVHGSKERGASEG